MAKTALVAQRRCSSAGKETGPFCVTFARAVCMRAIVCLDGMHHAEANRQRLADMGGAKPHLLDRAKRG